MREKAQQVSWLGSDTTNQGLRKKETKVEYRKTKGKKDSVVATQPKHNQDMDGDNRHCQRKSETCKRLWERNQYVLVIAWKGGE